MRIFVLDDDETIARVIGTILKSTGSHTVVTETDPVIAAITADNYDLVISDFAMPRMNGIEFLEIVAMRTPWTKRVLLTALPDVDEVLKAVKSGIVQHVLTKPPSIADIEAVVEGA